MQLVETQAGRPPEAASAKRREQMERLANGVSAATGCRSGCSEITGPFRRGRMWVLCAALSNVCVPIFFAFRFVSDFRRRQPIATIQEIFSDGSSETKWPLGSKRNGPPETRGETAGGVAPEFARYRR